MNDSSRRHRISEDKPGLFSLLTLPAVLCLAAHLLPAQNRPPSEEHVTPIPQTVELENLPVVMRDRVYLRADVFLPLGSGRWPTILVRTPYDRRTVTSRNYRFFAEHGYAVVLQDVRGRSGSEGTFGSIAQEGPDGVDTLNWIAAQPWSNGNVGMVGASYVGMTQWWAAVENNPHLKAIFPLLSGDDEYMDRYYSPGGALQLGHRLIWLAENLTPYGVKHPSYDTYIRHLPLKSSDIAATTVALGLWREPLQHPSYDRFWTALSIRSKLSSVSAAVCSMGGWFDNYAESDLNAFAMLAKRGARVETWIGPWPHTLIHRYPTIDFGPTASPRTRTLQLRWFDRYLKGSEGSDSGSGPLLHLFVMGANVWRDERAWPLPDTRYTPMYLDSHGHANSSSGDGELRRHFELEHSPDQFTYDPHSPVPTMGGAVCCNPKLMPAGPLDQKAIEQRDDVLVYTSKPVTQPLEVTGPVGATIYVATSANDTDFSAKLVDVFPDGRPLLVTDGLTRLRYRMSLAAPVFVKRNVPYQIHIDMGVTSWEFQAGHRIRLEISSSNFPRYDRNLNSARPNAEESKSTKAFQTVYHERKYPSVLVLPVISRVRSPTVARDSHSRVNPFSSGVR